MKKIKKMKDDLLKEMQNPLAWVGIAIYIAMIFCFRYLKQTSSAPKWFLSISTLCMIALGLVIFVFLVIPEMSPDENLLKAQKYVSAIERTGLFRDPSLRGLVLQNIKSVYKENIIAKISSAEDIWEKDPFDLTNYMTLFLHGEDILQSDEWETYNSLHVEYALYALPFYEFAMYGGDPIVLLSPLPPWDTIDHYVDEPLPYAISEKYWHLRKNEDLILYVNNRDLLESLKTKMADTEKIGRTAAGISISGNLTKEELPTLNGTKTVLTLNNIRFKFEQ